MGVDRFTATDRQQEIARVVFNRRAGTDADLELDNLDDHLHECSTDDLVSVFIAVFLMYGLKLGALKHRTGFGANHITAPYAGSAVSIRGYQHSKSVQLVARPYVAAHSCLGA